MDCAVSGCFNEAKWQLGWQAWLVDHPKTSNPLKCCMNMVVCDEHKARLTIKDLLIPECAEALNRQLEERGRAPLDLNRAEPLFYEIIDGVLWSERELGERW